MIKEFEERVVNILLYDEIIPRQEIFQIKEYHLEKYIETYHDLFGKKNKGVKTNSNFKFARKLAGLTLLKVNYIRGAKFKDMKSGLVYMIENPAFPEHYKVGMTIDLNSRLDSYQTYDPYRRYRVTKYDFVLNRSKIEKLILLNPNIINENGEWIKKENAIEIFEKICFIPR